MNDVYISTDTIKNMKKPVGLVDQVVLDVGLQLHSSSCDNGQMRFVTTTEAPSLTQAPKNCLNIVNIYNSKIVRYKHHVQTLEHFMSTLEKTAGEKGLRHVKWHKDDRFFRKINKDIFKSKYMSRSGSTIISLITPRERIEVKDRRNEKKQGGHSGRNKLLAGLRSKYHWKGMTRDVARYVIDCEKCKLTQESQ